jgi:hypothetical protein
LRVLLFELALDFVPGTFELEFVHINHSVLAGAVGCIKSEATLGTTLTKGVPSREDRLLYLRVTTVFKLWPFC